jgi:hypothetical protein
MTNKREPIDMSPVALARRLEQVRALYKLMVYLGQARIEGAQPVVLKSG